MQIRRVMLLSVLLTACSDPEDFGVDPAFFSGAYVLDSINSRPLPGTVSTTWLDGAVSSGTLDIDKDANYWVRMSIRPTAGPAGNLTIQGYVRNVGGEELEFRTPTGELQWRANLSGVRLSIPDMIGVPAQFRRVGPYRRRS